MSETRELLQDKRTFLYVRNGEQVYCMSTEIDFDSELFPDREHSATLADYTGELYMRREWNEHVIISKDRYEGLLEEYAADVKQHELDLVEYKRWKALPERRGADDEEEEKTPISYVVTGNHAQDSVNRDFARGYRGHFHPKWSWGPDAPTDPRSKYERVSPETVWYDDAMKSIAKETRDHNRIAVVLQGLLDRSPAFHPHPPWRLWTAEGFQLAIELVYDQSRAIAPGPEIDFNAYRAELAKSIKVGSLTVGQEDIWERAEAVKENARQDRSWRGRSRNIEHTHYRPYGNKGPGLIARVEKIITKRNGTKHAVFTWTRKRQRASRWNSHLDRERMPCSITVPVEQLFNLSAYTPGDFRMFYNDPRTRAKYLKWAPFLLLAEDYHAGKRDARGSKRIRVELDDDEEETEIEARVAIETHDDTDNDDNDDDTESEDDDADEA